MHESAVFFTPATDWGGDGSGGSTDPRSTDQGGRRIRGRRIRGRRIRGRQIDVVPYFSGFGILPIKKNPATLWAIRYRSKCTTRLPCLCDNLTNRWRTMLGRLVVQPYVDISMGTTLAASKTATYVLLMLDFQHCRDIYIVDSL
jgi:hypothetical protein